MELNASKFNIYLDDLFNDYDDVSMLPDIIENFYREHLTSFLFHNSIILKKIFLNQNSNSIRIIYLDHGEIMFDNIYGFNFTVFTPEKIRNHTIKSIIHEE